VPKYLVLYRSPVPASEMMRNSTPEQAQANMEGWMRWAGHAGSALVDLGSPLATAGTVGNKSDSGTPIGGFSVLEADSVDALKKVLDGHPHLGSPEGSIEVLEFLPIPGM
jgi:K+-transporting ATPase A subunit